MDPKDVKDHKDNASIDDTFAEGTQEETARVVDHIAERQLCRKFDVRLMPVLAIMCTFTPRYLKSGSQVLTVLQIYSMRWTKEIWEMRRLLV
jgi:hypothetical protein